MNTPAQRKQNLIARRVKIRVFTIQPCLQHANQPNHMTTRLERQNIDERNIYFPTRTPTSLATTDQVCSKLGTLKIDRPNYIADNLKYQIHIVVMLRCL